MRLSVSVVMGLAVVFILLASGCVQQAMEGAVVATEKDMTGAMSFEKIYQICVDDFSRTCESSGESPDDWDEPVHKNPYGDHIACSQIVDCSCDVGFGQYSASCGDLHY